MADARLDVAAIVGALRAHEVRFVVIGGLAAVAHGSPIPTEDIDITPERSEENLARLSAALHDLGARIRTDAAPEGLPFDHDARSLDAVGVWNLLTDHGALDISMVPNGTTGFHDLAAGLTDIEAFGVVIPIASLADVIRSKQAANRPKDQRVLPVLREILASRHDR